jgi:hypothetical protein
MRRARAVYIPGLSKVLGAGFLSNELICKLTLHRSKSLVLEYPPVYALSTPDGSCLLLVDSYEDNPRLRCLHWTSFGENRGIELPIPSDISSTYPMGVSAFGRRDNIHIISLDLRKRNCLSVAINITQKSNLYAFRRSGAETTKRQSIATSNNSLIRCHSEIWTRFPIHPPISRQPDDRSIRGSTSILFVSCLIEPPFTRHFRWMVSEFEGETRKPTEGKLRDIRVDAAHNWKSSTDRLEISTYLVGDWLVGLFCLIPIHLAVTDSNRFIPLKDGVDSSGSEDHLFGMDVLQIIQTLV